MCYTIRHTGIIERIEEHTVFVKIVQQSACAGCHAQSMCATTESKEKVITVPDSSGSFHTSEQVWVCGQRSMGLQAVLLAFVFPVIAVVLTVIFGVHRQWSEGVSALTGLSLLLPYYGILYLFRHALKKRFVFTIQKINEYGS
ncbi:MAG: SoxR reducing system RseC family protein [Tannerellaceae bacterium]|nr:SoxR reducing system RseC family protein [Tannerellaceae bacterium]